MVLGESATLWRRVQILALAVWCIVFLFGSIWFVQQRTKNAELRQLFDTARQGDLASVDRLSESRSSFARFLLEKLTHDSNSPLETRLAALTALGRKRWVDASVLSPLLDVSQPFAIRHATVRVFYEYGCDQVCVEADLYALHTLYEGRLTSEATYAAQHPPLTSRERDLSLELKNATIEDYRSLLNRNPCVARKVLQTVYSSESEFVHSITPHISGC